MPDFIFAYHGGKMPETPEEGEKVMAAWRAWMGGMGTVLKDPGNPLGKSWTVSPKGADEGGGSNPLSGYSIVTASDLQAAIALTKGCPHLDGGTVEVAEILPM